MKVRCPTCGAVMSLDVLIAHDDAREALIALTGISDDLFKAVLRYLTLFRPAEKDLSFNRVSKLVGEIAPMIRDPAAFGRLCVETRSRGSRGRGAGPAIFS